MWSPDIMDADLRAATWGPPLRYRRKENNANAIFQIPYYQFNRTYYQLIIVNYFVLFPIRQRYATMPALRFAKSITRCIGDFISIDCNTESKKNWHYDLCHADFFGISGWDYFCCQTILAATTTTWTARNLFAQSEIFAANQTFARSIANYVSRRQRLRRRHLALFKLVYGRMDLVVFYFLRGGINDFVVDSQTKLMIQLLLYLNYSNVIGLSDLNNQII